MQIGHCSRKAGLTLGIMALFIGLLVVDPNAHAQKAGEKFLVTLGAANADDIDKTPALKKPAIALGNKVYQANCASCHGANLRGAAGRHAPDLSDKSTLYSSDNVDADPDQIFASDIETTVRYGIRADHEKTRKLAFMPGFAGLDPKQEGGYPTLADQDIADLAEYLVSVQGLKADAVRAARGKKLFGDAGGCYDCHGADAEGNGAIGAPGFNVAKNYLYGSDRASITASIHQGRKGLMPAYEARLTPAEIKAVSYYLFTVQRAAKK